MTKTPFGKGEQGEQGGQRCAASVDYPGRRGACRVEAKYPDPDGVRWWCGIHRPKKDKVMDAKVVYVSPASESASPCSDGSLSLSPEETYELLMAAKAAQQALNDIANTRPVGWQPTDPAEKYRVILEHACDTARNALQTVTSELSRITKMI